jgi:hypothetical protein
VTEEDVVKRQNDDRVTVVYTAWLNTPLPAG